MSVICNYSTMHEYIQTNWLTYYMPVWSSLVLAQLLPQRLTSLEVRGAPCLERPLLNGLKF